MTPDERTHPNPADLAAGRDPVLARAVTLAGDTLAADQTGWPFLVVWPGR